MLFGRFFIPITNITLIVPEDLDLLGKTESVNLVTRFVGINPADYRPFDVVVSSHLLKLPDVC